MIVAQFPMPWLKRYHPVLWQYWLDGLLTKREVYLTLEGKII